MRSFRSCKIACRLFCRIGSREIAGSFFGAAIGLRPDGCDSNAPNSRVQPSLKTRRSSAGLAVGLSIPETLSIKYNNLPFLNQPATEKLPNGLL